MHSGEVKELGSHDELIANENGLYSSLVRLQRIGDTSSEANTQTGRIGCTSASERKLKDRTGDQRGVNGSL